MFADGQNLNFAVPIEVLKDLLSRNSAAIADIGSLVEQITSLQTQQSEEKYSQDPDSGYQKKQNEIESLLNKGITVAGNNPEALLKVAKVAEHRHGYRALDRRTCDRRAAICRILLTFGGHSEFQIYVDTGR